MRQVPYTLRNSTTCFCQGCSTPAISKYLSPLPFLGKGSAPQKLPSLPAPSQSCNSVCNVPVGVDEQVTRTAASTHNTLSRRPRKDQAAGFRTEHMLTWKGTLSSLQLHQDNKLALGAQRKTSHLVSKGIPRLCID